MGTVVRYDKVVFREGGSWRGGGRGRETTSWGGGWKRGTANELFRSHTIGKNPTFIRTTYLELRISLRISAESRPAVQKIFDDCVRLVVLTNGRRVRAADSSRPGRYHGGSSGGDRYNGCDDVPALTRRAGVPRPERPRHKNSTQCYFYDAVDGRKIFTDQADAEYCMSSAAGWWYQAETAFPLSWDRLCEAEDRPPLKVRQGRCGGSCRCHCAVACAVDVASGGGSKSTATGASSSSEEQHESCDEVLELKNHSLLELGRGSTSFESVRRCSPSLLTLSKEVFPFLRSDLDLKFNTAETRDKVLRLFDATVSVLRSRGPEHFKSLGSELPEFRDIAGVLSAPLQKIGFALDVDDSRALDMDDTFFSLLEVVNGTAYRERHGITARREMVEDEDHDGSMQAAPPGGRVIMGEQGQEAASSTGKAGAPAKGDGESGKKEGVDDDGTVPGKAYRERHGINGGSVEEPGECGDGGTRAGSDVAGSDVAGSDVAGAAIGGGGGRRRQRTAAEDDEPLQFHLYTVAKGFCQDLSSR